QQHAATTRGRGAAGTVERADARAADVVEAFQVQHQRRDALVIQQGVKRLVQFRVTAGIQSAAYRDPLDAVLRGSRFDPELTHGKRSPDPRVLPAWRCRGSTMPDRTVEIAKRACSRRAFLSRAPATQAGRWRARASAAPM